MGDKALTKADLAEHLFEELGLNKREAKEIVELFFEEIRLSLEKQSACQTVGFRQFRIAQQKAAARQEPEDGRRDSHRGRAAWLPFRPGQKLKSNVEGYDGLDD